MSDNAEPGEPPSIVVEGTLFSYRSTVDGGLTVIIHLEESQKHLFHNSFDNGVRIALARLHEDPETEG